MQTNQVANLVGKSISRLTDIRSKLTAYWEWVFLRWTTILICFCLALVCFAAYIATDDRIVIGPFSVPREYGDRGYTSEAIGNAVVQFIHGNGSTVAIMQTARADEQAETDVDEEDDDVGEHEFLQNIDGRHVVSSFDQSTISNIHVPLTSFTLESLEELIRSTVGHQPTRIAGEIVFSDERDSKDASSRDPQSTKVFIRYRIVYPEPSYPIAGYHWWSRRATTITETLTAEGAEDVIRKLALVTADAVNERTLIHEQAESRAQRYIARGNAYLGLGDYDRASRMYEQANATVKKSGKPGSAHALLALGVIAEREREYEKAKELYTSAAAIHDGDTDDDAAWAQLYSANLLVKAELKKDEAIRRYQTILGNRTKSASFVHIAAYNNVGFLFSSKRQWAEAGRNFENALKLAQSVREKARACGYEDAEGNACGAGLAESDRLRAKSEALLAIALTNQHIALSFYGLGAVEQHTGTLVKAEDFYWQSIHANEKHAPTHFRLAKMYTGKGRYKEAVEQYQAAIQSDAEYEPAYTAWKDLIEHWRSLPDKKRADKPLNRTLASNYKMWGENLRRAGNPDEASDRFCSAAELDAQYKQLCPVSSR